MSLSKPALLPLARWRDQSRDGVSFRNSPVLIAEVPFDNVVWSRLARLSSALTYAEHLRQEQEDCLQEALVKFWQIQSSRPAESLPHALGECRTFLRDRLRLGKSVDSPKRRWRGYSLDCNPTALKSEVIAALVCSIGPAEHARVKDDIEQLQLRLKTREKAILSSFLEGKGTREVARQMRISPPLVTRSSAQIRSAAMAIGLNPGNRAGRKSRSDEKFM